MARQYPGLTQTQVARAAGVSQQMVAKAEHPDYSPGLEVVERIAKALGLQASMSFSKRAPALARKRV